jgi:hypothetical protein
VFGVPDRIFCAIAATLIVSCFAACHCIGVADLSTLWQQSGLIRIDKYSVKHLPHLWQK